MAEWLDVRAVVPGLRGRSVHVAPLAREAELRAALVQAGFTIRLVEGTRIVDEDSLFRQLRRAFDLAGHFGSNWDALNDVLGELAGGANPRLAVLWRGADTSLAADPQTVLDAVLAFDAAAVSSADGEPPGQLELFLLLGRPA